MRTLRMPKNPSRRAVRNQLAFMGGSTQMEPPSKRSGPRGKQPESLVGKANRQWAALRGGVLRRNRRGMVDLASGAKMPIGLAEPLILDEIGYLTITVTPEMLGRRIAVLLVIEDKTDTGVLGEHQRKCIEELRDAGAIAGVSTGPEDSERILQAWRAGK